MARINHLDAFTRVKMIGKLEEGRTVTSVAEDFGIIKSVVSRAWKAFQTTGTAVRKVGGGCPRTATAGDDQYIILQEKRGRRQSASAVAQQFSTATGRQVSRLTVELRLHKGGYSPAILNAASRCKLTTDATVCSGAESTKTGQLSMKSGSVIGNRYCEEVLLPHVRRFLGAIGPDLFFMDNSTRPHRTFDVEELLESEDITRMECSAYSPDLNPIEHVWDALRRRITARLHHPENTQ
ncbi:transposable element Tcb2 transposase [Trichonephila clavipes]|uniref:Transposable element Tcb2 transposase n=1 Tax=Trichonephila clavipes TaxID=2585209 RepID=A0A8X6VG03_TRICX|nr:transposable element Tcb2 transposase [Trichonephila clavipes]